VEQWGRGGWALRPKGDRPLMMSGWGVKEEKKWGGIWWGKNLSRRFVADKSPPAE